MPGGPRIHVSGGREQTEPPSGSMPKGLIVQGNTNSEHSTASYFQHFCFFPSMCFEWILLFKIYFFSGCILTL